MNKNYQLNNQEYATYEEYREALKKSDNRYRAYEAWTDEEDKELTELSKTMRVPELADHFKRAEGGIRSRLHKHLSNAPPKDRRIILNALRAQNNHGKPWTRALEVELMELVDNGFTSDEIAKKIKRTPLSVELTIKRVKIEKFLKQRKIEKLIHFTDKRNLNSIEKVGILPRKTLEEKNIKYFYNDANRYDGKLGGTSVSVSSLNKHLFETFHRKNRKRKWVQIEIDPNILLGANCFFYSSNAASNMFKGVSDEYLGSFDALEKMFAETVTSSSRVFKRKDQAINQTTDDQAEIIINRSIPRAKLLSWAEINV